MLPTLSTRPIDHIICMPNSIIIIIIIIIIINSTIRPLRIITITT